MRKKTKAMILAMMTVVGVSSAFTTPPVEAGIINAPYKIQENQRQKMESENPWDKHRKEGEKVIEVDIHRDSQPTDIEIPEVGDFDGDSSAPSE